MKVWFQRLVNAIVIFFFVSWWLVPFIQSYLPYEDEITPDEVASLDEEIDAFLAEMSPNFPELYNARRGLPAYELTYPFERKELSTRDNFERNKESVVYITTEGIDGWTYIGAGTVLTTNGVVMTNYHVIDNALKVVVTTADGVHYPVVGVISSDELLDIAFLKIDAEDLTPVVVGNSDTVHIGDATIVIGHPESFLHTLSVGNVSGIRSYTSHDAGTNIQITNPISSGNSGGGVFNEVGELIGVPTWRLEYDNNIVQVQNLNFAVPINEAIEVLYGS